MLKSLVRIIGSDSSSLVSACSLMGCGASRCWGGSQYTRSLMHGHQMFQHAWASTDAVPCTRIFFQRRPASGMCQAALRMRQVSIRTVSFGCQRHLCGFSLRPFTSSPRLCSIPKARPALPVKDFEGSKRYSFRQKKWHKKIDKKRPNMPPREPLPPKHPARIVQSERCEQPNPCYSFYYGCALPICILHPLWLLCICMLIVWSHDVHTIYWCKKSKRPEVSSTIVHIGGVRSICSSAERQNRTQAAVCMRAVRESYLDRSRTLDASLVLEDLPEEEEDPWSEGDASRGAREPQEWRPVRQLHVSSEEALSNNSDMQLVFFGTSAGRMSRYRCALCCMCLAVAALSLPKSWGKKLVRELS